MAVAARIKEKHLPSRVAGKRSPSLVGAIEGTIIATAVVVGLDESDSVTPHRGFWILVATGSFFWIAHVYADLLADRIKGHHRMGRHAIGTVMAREWPLLQSSFVLAIPLALGAAACVELPARLRPGLAERYRGTRRLGSRLLPQGGSRSGRNHRRRLSQRRSRATHRRVQGGREVSATGPRDDVASAHEGDRRPK